MARAQPSLADGYNGVVALERAKVFDRGNHAKWMNLGKGRRADRRGCHASIGISKRVP
jgi:hypothetical protein